MRRAKPAAWLLAFVLTVASVTALAASGPSGRGESGDDDAMDGNATANATSPGNSSFGRDRGSGDGDDDGDAEDNEGPGSGEDRGARQLARERHEEREAFEDAFEERREACRDNGTERAACERALSEEFRDFLQGQREAFEAARDALRAAAAGDRLGRFALANGTFVGTFVTFGWNASIPAVTDYTVGGCLVFSRIAIAGAADEAELEFSHHGRVVKVEAGEAKVQLHDNPGGVVNARAPEDGRVEFTLAAGITGVLNGSRLALSGCANWTATLGGHDLVFADGAASVDRQATFVAHDDNPALPPAAGEHRGAVERAKVRGHVGAEVTVVGHGDDDVDEVELDEALAVSTQHQGAGGLRVIVSGTGTEPRTVIVNVAPGLIVADHVVVRFFDEADGAFHEVALGEASSLEDALDPNDDDGPEAWVQHGPGGTVVYVSIDSWSIHAFTVQGVLSEVPASVVAGLLGAVLFVAAAGAGLFRRPRKP